MPAPSPSLLPDGPTRPDIEVARYPQLRLLAWSAPGAEFLTPEEALSLYERGWRHVDQSAIDPRERELIAMLVRTVGNGVMLV